MHKMFKSLLFAGILLVSAQHWVDEIYKNRETEINFIYKFSYRIKFLVMNSLIKPNYAYQDEQGRLRDIFRKTFGNEHRIRVT